MSSERQPRRAGEPALPPADRSARIGETGEMVQILVADPELGRFLPHRTLEVVASGAIAPLVILDKGARAFLIEERATHAHFGLLVLDGLLARHLTFGQIGSTEFLGPGDLIRPWTQRRARAEPSQIQWEVLSHARLAALDRDFANRIRPWPQLTAALLDRATERADSHLLQSALRQAARVEDRVLIALWHFAGRWGEMGSDGWTVALPNITGELLARVVGARRQSVSTALARLQRQGAIRRDTSSQWTVLRRPSQLETTVPDDALVERERQAEQ